ncbi:protein tramtrack, beta isoform-like isoform X1 [Ceratina calcarata]|uniref:Protein tramtrack, beta isoform-like isoform X1 n=1 Tax=Ceratina calcarata TaxID=156304 RepID=A0AAJ7J018_9HYME|nr:protein tramtrack, beta isoform-like isoform X1 [Ceratina calcarata]XP_017881378.1 protein tramtrack, beta isoform-like isoform X1 [Ceratina calcarata]
MAKDFMSEQFSLKWNNFSSNLTSGFLNHLSENDLVDVTLAVEGQLLQAHKLVLSVCSPYFKSIFKENPCQHPVIILKDMKCAEIESLLKFMYQGEININQEDLPTFLKVAQTLQIRGLTTEDTVNIKSFLGFELNEPTVQNIAQSSLSTINKVSKDVEMIDRRKRSRDLTRKCNKKAKHDTPVTVENTQNIFKEDMDNDDQDVLLLKDENDSIVNDSDNVYTTKNNENDENENATELAVDPTSKNPTQEDVEPVIYRLSARGRPQLVHEGYVYNLTSRSEALNRSHYRCAEQHRGCKGKCAVIAERFMPTGVHDHNHPPGYQSEHDYRKKKGLDADTS